MMAKLVKLREWVGATFESRISIRTAQSWCDLGYLPGAQKIGKLWFIDPEIQANTTGNHLVDEVLRHES